MEIKTKEGDVVLINESDYELVSSIKWHTHHKKNGDRYATGFQKKADGKWVPVAMHRLIAGTPKGMDTDHIDGNGLNNRRENLRICTRSQNLMNRGKQKNNTSGYKGVTWYTKGNKWRAQIRIEGKTFNLGHFVNKEDAYKRYQEVNKKLHKQFGKYEI